MPCSADNAKHPPVHLGQLVGLVHIKLEAQLDDPLHLAQLVVVYPRGQWKRERLSLRALRLTRERGWLFPCVAA